MTNPRKSDDDGWSDADAEVLSLLAMQAARGALRAPDGLRSRILTSARTEPFAFIHDGAGIWIDSHGGRIKELFHDSRDRAATRLLKLPAGVAVPPPSVVGARAWFMVAGSMAGAAGEIHAGDFVMNGDSSEAWHATADSLLLEFTSVGAATTGLFPVAGAAWQELFPGARMRPLVDGHDSAHSVFVLDMAAHSALGEHDHDGLEELFVLQGSCVIEGQPMARGDYHRASPGTHHHATASDEGCLLVVSVRDLPRLAA